LTWLPTKAVDFANIIQCYAIFTEESSMDNKIPLEAIFR
jgi:hypothetical protein